MLTQYIKDQIATLPAEQFVATWAAIDAITDALKTAGPVAQLALKFITERETETLVRAALAFEQTVTDNAA